MTSVCTPIPSFRNASSSSSSSSSSSLALNNLPLQVPPPGLFVWKEVWHAYLPFSMAPTCRSSSLLLSFMPCTVRMWSWDPTLSATKATLRISYAQNVAEVRLDRPGRPNLRQTRLLVWLCPQRPGIARSQELCCSPSGALWGCMQPAARHTDSHCLYV